MAGFCLCGSVLDGSRIERGAILKNGISPGGWLVGWLVGRAGGRSIGWLVSYLVSLLVSCLVSWLVSPSLSKLVS